MESIVQSIVKYLTLLSSITFDIIITATNNISPTLTVWGHFLSPVSKCLALPESAADLNSLFTVWWFIALNTIFLIIKNCSLASGSRNRLMQDLCRNTKWAERQMTCSASLKAFFLLIIFWDLRKAGCDAGEKPGEMCHSEVRWCSGSHYVHMLSQIPPLI